MSDFLDSLYFTNFDRVQSTLLSNAKAKLQAEAESEAKAARDKAEKESWERVGGRELPGYVRNQVIATATIGNRAYEIFDRKISSYESNQKNLAEQFETASLAQSDAERFFFNGEATRGDLMAANSWLILNYDRGTDGGANLSDKQRHALEGVAAQEGTLKERAVAYHQAIRDNLIENRDRILEQRRAAHIAAEDKRINGKDAISLFAGTAKGELDGYKAYSNDEIQRLQDAVDENNSFWGKLSGKHGEAQEALKAFKAESDAELKRLEEEAKPRPFDEQKANKDLDALISKYSDAADKAQKARDEARQKARDEGAEKVRALSEKAEKQEQALKQSNPAQAPEQPKPEQPQPSPEKPVQQPEVPRAEPEKPAEQPTQVPEQKEPEQPSRDQVPPTQEPPTQKPEPQQVPEQPKPVEAPQQVPDQKPEVPRAEPEKPAEQPTQVPEQKKPEQPSRDQVPPDQKAPTVEPVKPEPQKAPERPQSSPEKPVQKPDAPVQAPDQKPEVPRAEPEKPAEQPSRDQVPPAQEPPTQKPEPQQVPEQPKPEQPKPVEAPVQAPDQKPEVPRAEPEKPVEQPSRDQVPPAQEPPTQKPELQQVPEQPKPEQPKPVDVPEQPKSSPEKPVQEPGVPDQQGDQPRPHEKPAQSKPSEQPSSRPENKATPEQRGNPPQPGKPGQTKADGQNADLPKLKEGPPKIDGYSRDDKGRYKKANESGTAFIDKGDAGVSVRRPPSNADLSASMKLLQQKGANNIQLNGSDEFKKRAWIEANARGIKTKGYEPTQEDKRAMQNRAEQLRKVAEMNGINRGASQTLGARQNQGSRKPREEDQPPPPPPKPVQGAPR